MYSFENFYLATVADWSRCEIPERLPDYVSFSGSAYWDCGDRVKRLADHWGDVASCRWFIEGTIFPIFICGECHYEEFRSMKVFEHVEPVES